MYQDNVLQSLAINAREGKLQTYQNTMTVTAVGIALLSIDLPDWANSFRIYPSAVMSYAVNEAPTLLAAVTATWVVGGYLAATTWLEKSIDSGLSRTLQLKTAATTTTVIVEVF